MNMNAATPALPALQHRLEHFPIAFFSTVMGIAGLALAWLKAHAVLGMPVEIGEGLRKRGYSETDIEGILSGNFLRKLRETLPA